VLAFILQQIVSKYTAVVLALRRTYGEFSAPTRRTLSHFRSSHDKIGLNASSSQSLTHRNSRQAAHYHNLQSLTLLFLTVAVWFVSWQAALAYVIIRGDSAARILQVVAAVLFSLDSAINPFLCT
jgi:hypothetical protein